MAKNWMAYEAAEAIIGNNVDEIAEVGSRYPLFTRVVSMANSEHVLDLLKAIPKTTARVIETGLKDSVDETEMEEVQEEAPKKAPKKVTPKSKQPVQEEETEAEDDYDSMTSKDLYKLCCERGISSKCKDRKKSTLIELLKANDAGESLEDDAEDWDEEEETNPYEGKTAKELFKMCTDRGIKTKPKQPADAYVKLLKKADETDTEVEEEDDDDDDWEI